MRVYLGVILSGACKGEVEGFSEVCGLLKGEKIYELD
jgi:hypothetical protein